VKRQRRPPFESLLSNTLLLLNTLIELVMTMMMMNMNMGFISTVRVCVVFFASHEAKAGLL
jgi:ABC-type polar amino acid transport system ATPase subunit